MIRHFIAILFSVMLLFPSLSMGQLNNKYFYNDSRIDSAYNKSLRIGLDVMGFVRNNEYFNNILQGYTLFGYQFMPYLSLFPAKNFRLDGGVFLLRDFGGHNFRQVAPYLRLKYSVKNFSLIFGNIDGALNHRLVEPVFDFERVINNRLEQGLQVKWDSEKLFIDSWVNWENFIQFGDTTQEIFTAGISGDLTLTRRGRLLLTVPAQIVARHHGGQINVSNAPVYTVYNSAIGLKIKYDLSRTGFFRSMLFDGFYVNYSGDPSVLSIPYSRGNGYLFNLVSATRYFDFYITYWHGHDYYSPLGMPMYQSVSYDYENDHHTEPYRDLVFLRFFYERELTEGLRMSFRFEPVYDLRNNILDHSEALYLIFNPSWSLVKFK
jgi:hypothetical protein